MHKTESSDQRLIGLLRDGDLTALERLFGRHSRAIYGFFYRTTGFTTGLDGRATRLIEGRIAGGGPRYYFHTANGTIYLRQAGP